MCKCVHQNDAATSLNTLVPMWCPEPVEPALSPCLMAILLQVPGVSYIIPRPTFSKLSTKDFINPTHYTMLQIVNLFIQRARAESLPYTRWYAKPGGTQVNKVQCWPQRLCILCSSLLISFPNALPRTKQPTWLMKAEMYVAFSHGTTDCQLYWTPKLTYSMLSHTFLCLRFCLSVCKTL